MNRIILGIVLVFFLIFPVFNMPYLNTFLIILFMYVLLAESYDLLGGYTGYINMGHIAFFGIGAYAAGMLYTKAGLPFWVDVPLAALVAGAVGALLGIPCLRVRDDFLAITTMGINFVVEARFPVHPFLRRSHGDRRDRSSETAGRRKKRQIV